MTIPKIEHIGGDRNTEYITLRCTGCSEHSSYSVRQYKGDFGCNLSEFEHFLQWAMWEAAKHECFLAGRMGYMPPIADEFIFSGDSPGVRAERAAFERTFPGSLNFHPPERHEDPWAEEIMTGGYWPDEFDDEEADLDTWIDLGIDDEEEEEPFGDNYGWDENRFDFLYGRDDKQPYITLETVTGCLTSDEEYRWREQVRASMQDNPRFILKLEAVPQTTQAEMVYIEFDFAELERRMIDQMLLDAGIYSLDEHGCLRDEKNRCLACLRPGPHLPFYWKRDHGR